MENYFDEDILICIYNYKLDENARFWKNLLSPHFETVVLDSGNDKIYNDFLQFPNIYYSGLFNETKKLTNKKKYKWIGVIPSDITIDKRFIEPLLEKIKWLKETKDIGIWQPSLDSTSRNWIGNIHTDRFDLEKKKVIEAHFFFIREDVLSDVPMIDLTENKYGYGVSEILSGMSTKKGLSNIFDNTLQIHHPEETKYDRSAAIKESSKWTPMMCKKLGLDYNYLIQLSVNSLGKYTEAAEKIIVTMTTWKKRISNIPTVLDTILNQTKMPDKIVINLSSEEFPEKEKEFDKEIIDYLSKNQELIEINWIDGPNIRSWKKSIPTFKLYPNDAIICIDDDLLYPNFFIETLWNKHIENPHGPITWASYRPKGCFYQHCGCASLDKAEYYPSDIDIFLKTDITNIPDEDSFMTYMAAKNGTPTISIGYPFNLNNYNPVEPMSLGRPDGEARDWIEKYFKEPIQTIYTKYLSISNTTKQNEIENAVSSSKLVTNISEVFDATKNTDISNDVLAIYAGTGFTYPFKASAIKEVHCDTGSYANGFSELVSTVFDRKYKWILFIKDSVRFIGNTTVSNKIKQIIGSTSNIGLYTPSALYDYQSSASRRVYRSGYRAVNEIADDVFLVNTSALNGLKGVDFSMCRTGSGFIKYLCSLVKKNGFSIVIDDSVCYTKNYSNSVSDEIMERNSAWFIRENKIDTSNLKTSALKLTINQ